MTGDVLTALRLNASHLAGMPRDHVELTEQDGEKTTYEGVPLQEILKKAGIPFGVRCEVRPWRAMFSRGQGRLCRYVQPW